MTSPLTRRVGLTAAALLLAMSVAHATTGSGKQATEARQANGFSAISLRGDMDVIVRQGAREAVQVSADDNLLPLLQTIVEGNTLRIQWAPGESVHSRGKTVVTVDVINLRAIASSGSGNVVVEPLKTPALSLSISGSSDAKLKQLDTEQFKLSIAGSGDVQVDGKAAKLEISIAGSGDVRARELAADDVSVSIAGSGDASLQARKSLAVSIAGSGSVEYTGSATLAKSRVAGSGSIRQRP